MSGRPGKLHLFVPSPADEASAQSAAVVSAVQKQDKAPPTAHKEQTPAKMGLITLHLMTKYVYKY